MKKIVSIILTLCLVVGIGACGMVPAGAAEFGDITKEFAADLYLLPYSYAMTMPGLRPEVEAGLLPGKDIDSVFAALETILEAWSADIDDTTDSVSAVPPEVKEELLTACEALFAESFSAEFLVTFGAFKSAMVQAFAPLGIVVTGFDNFDEQDAMVFVAKLWNPLLFFEVMNVLMWMAEAGEPIFESGNFAQFTSFFEELERRISEVSLISTQKWWQRLPYFLQTILRFLFFGWAWMK